MTSSSAALSILALLLFASSTQLLVHAQLIPTIGVPGFPPINIPGFPPINIPGLPSFRIPPFGLPPLRVPPVGIPPVGVPPVGSPLPDLITVAGQLCCTANGTCPGQALAGVPATLTCLANNTTPIVARTVTNENGTFIFNSTLSLAGVANTVSTSMLPVCLVSIPRSAVNATLCSALGATGSALNTTGGVLLAVVQFIGPIVGQVLNARVTGFFII